MLLAACGSPSGQPDAAPTDVPDEVDAAPGCACTYGAPIAAGPVTTAGATELSGLAASRRLADTLWTHNDSGDTARLFAITRTGASLGVGTLVGATATDWEDIAIAPCGATQCLYVGDIGDNNLARAMIRIYEVDEPTMAIAGPVNLTYRAFDVAYPDGPHNAESLFVDPRDGKSYLITKQASSPSTVFELPRTMGATGTAIAAGSLMIPSPGNLLVTAADLQVDGCGVRLLVRTYDRLFEVRGEPTDTIAQLLARPAVAVPVAIEAQGEAVAYLPDGRAYLTVSEGAAPQLTRVSCR